MISMELSTIRGIASPSQLLINDKQEHFYLGDQLVTVKPHKDGLEAVISYPFPVDLMDAYIDLNLLGVGYDADFTKKMYGKNDFYYSLFGDREWNIKKGYEHPGNNVLLYFQSGSYCRPGSLDRLDEQRPLMFFREQLHQLNGHAKDHVPIMRVSARESVPGTSLIASYDLPLDKVLPVVSKPSFELAR